jgi:hypothetical protein
VLGNGRSQKTRRISNALSRRRQDGVFEERLARRDPRRVQLPSSAQLRSFTWFPQRQFSAPLQRSCRQAVSRIVTTGSRGLLTEHMALSDSSEAACDTVPQPGTSKPSNAPIRAAARTTRCHHHFSHPFASVQPDALNGFTDRRLFTLAIHARSMPATQHIDTGQSRSIRDGTKRLSGCSVASYCAASGDAALNN